MPHPRSRFSHRHLLALCTFLVPLAVLAVLGQSELQREGTRATAARAGEAQQFLQGAAQAVNTQFDLQMPDLVKRSEELLADKGAVRTALLLREQEGFAALLDIILLDAQFTPVWPRRTDTFGLPFSSDAQPGDAITEALQCADFLLTKGETKKAVALFEHLLTLIEVADPQRQGPMQGYELEARFRLATAHYALGEIPEARAGFEDVRNSIFDPVNGPPSSQSAELGLLADTKLAEMGSTTADRVKLLREIAGSRHDRVADGLLTAIAERLSAGVPAGDPLRPEATGLLREERQRAQTRTFAYDYALILRDEVRRLNLVSTRMDEGIPGDVQIISTLGGATSLLWVRPATEPERNKAVNATDGTSGRGRDCRRVGLHFDLGQLLAPALQPFFGSDGTFVLAIEDPGGKAIIPAPPGVAEDYVAPSIEVRGLRLSAFPANVEQRLAQKEAAARNRTFLVLALFVTAVAGALWLWRSVSREHELASLKVDLVSRVSHELKTPLALIRMYGETLGMGRARDADQACHFGGIIARESERLTTLIQRILDFSRQQAGTLQYTPELVDLGDLLRKVCEAYTPHLEARGAVLIDSLPSGIEVRCDASACESAIVNLLENAAKYAIEGDDEHEIELLLTSKDGFATIAVLDRGRGIPEAERERVFDGFYRASNAGEVRGAGLGLSLVRHFARAHGGEAVVLPREGGGCVFRLNLPLASAQPPNPPSRP